MKYFSKKIVVMAAVASVAVLTGCGSAGQDDPANMNNGLGYGGSYGTGGCIPINASNTRIGFIGRGIRYELQNVVGGRIPMAARTPFEGQTFGTMTVTTNAAGGSFQRTSQDGTISFSLTPATMAQPVYNNGYYPVQPQQIASTTATVTGYLMLSAAVVNDILYQNGGMQPMGYSPYGVPMPTPQLSSVCVSGIAMSVGIQRDYNNNPIGLYGNAVYLYLNRTDHGYIVYP